MTESKEKLKDPLMRMKEENEKNWLKTQLSKRKNQPLVPPLHGKYKGEKWKQWQISFSWVPKSLQMVTAAMEF